MGRERKPFERPQEQLDSRLIIIATEGSETEKNYFDVLVSSEFYYNKKVHVVVIPSQNGKSSPRHVFDRIDDFYKTYDIQEDDTLYIVIDKDRWTESTLSSIAASTQQKQFSLIVSNPCFELWLLLHKVDVESLSIDDREALYKINKVNSNRNYINKYLSNKLVGYNKTNKDVMKNLMPNIKSAISNAKKLDINKSHRWPNELGTRVYIVVNDIISHTK